MMLKGLTVQINWAATQTRPDLALAVIELIVKYSSPSVSDLINANKAV